VERAASRALVLELLPALRRRLDLDGPPVAGVPAAAHEPCLLQAHHLAGDRRRVEALPLGQRVDPERPLRAEGEQQQVAGPFEGRAVPAAGAACGARPLGAAQQEGELELPAGQRVLARGFRPLRHRCSLQVVICGIQIKSDRTTPQGGRVAATRNEPNKTAIYATALTAFF